MPVIPTNWTAWETPCFRRMPRIILINLILVGQQQLSLDHMIGRVTYGELGRYAPDPQDDELSYGLYLLIGEKTIFVDIREDKFLEQREIKALQLVEKSLELKASLDAFVRENPDFHDRAVTYIGLHSKNLDQGEVFWDPSGYTVLRGLSFALE